MSQLAQTNNSNLVKAEFVDSTSFEEPPISSLPKELIENILGKLSSICSERMGLTCRKFNFFSSKNEDLWRDLLRRDYGEKVVLIVKDGNFKEAYKQCYKVQKFIIELPGGEQLLADSSRDKQIEICGLVSKESLAKYIDNLSVEELSVVFVSAARFGFLPIIEAIINKDDKFQLLAIDQNFRGLERALFEMAKHGHIEAMQMILQSNRIDELYESGELGRALRVAASSCQITTMEIIFNLPKFKENRAHELLELGRAFVSAAVDGQVESMDTIMKHPRFGELNIDEIFQEALQNAIESVQPEHGYEDAISGISKIVYDERFKNFDEKVNWNVGGALACAFVRKDQALIKTIMDTNRFRNKRDALLDALCKAIKMGSIDAVSELKAHPKFKDIDPKGLGMIFCLAASHNLTDLMEDIISDSRFNEIAMDGEFGLCNAFVNACWDEKNIQALTMIIKCSRFKDIPVDGPWGFGQAFGVAAFAMNLSAVNLIMSHPKYYELEPNGPFGLASVFIKASYDGTNIRVMELLMMDPRFEKIYPNGQEGLGYAFFIAVDNLNMKAIRLIMSHPKFGQIAANGEPYTLGHAFLVAKSKRNKKAARMIQRCKRFKEINPAVIYD